MKEWMEEDDQAEEENIPSSKRMHEERSLEDPVWDESFHR